MFRLTFAYYHGILSPSHHPIFQLGSSWVSFGHLPRVGWSWLEYWISSIFFSKSSRICRLSTPTNSSHIAKRMASPTSDLSVTVWPPADTTFDFALTWFELTRVGSITFLPVFYMTIATSLPAFKLMELYIFHMFAWNKRSDRTAVVKVTPHLAVCAFPAAEVGTRVGASVVEWALLHRSSWQQLIEHSASSGRSSLSGHFDCLAARSHIAFRPHPMAVKETPWVRTTSVVQASNFGSHVVMLVGRWHHSPASGSGAHW